MHQSYTACEKYTCMLCCSKNLVSVFREFLKICCRLSLPISHSGGTVPTAHPAHTSVCVQAYVFCRTDLGKWHFWVNHCEHLERWQLLANTEDSAPCANMMEGSIFPHSILHWHSMLAVCQRLIHYFNEYCVEELRHLHGPYQHLCSLPFSATDG